MVKARTRHLVRSGARLPLRNRPLMLSVRAAYAVAAGA
jgi:hypothetical protein